MAAIKVLLDTDPGGDDTFAFFWLQSLAKQGWAEIVAVTSVDGNVRSEYTFATACRLLRLGGWLEVEVGRAVTGSSTQAAAEAVHGTDGIGNLSQMLPEPHQAYETARSSDQLLIDQLTQAPGEITIVAIGPLTNLAAAEIRCPGILKLAKEIVIMGGAFLHPGNVTSEAEFNIAYDPIAAQLIFDRCQHLVMIPLDVTHQLIFTPAMAAQIESAQPQSPIAQFLVRLCQFMVQSGLKFRETAGVPGFLVHDAATLAYLFYPETLSFRRAQVTVETEATQTRGKTLIDRRHHPKPNTNAWIAQTVDAANLLAILVDDLKQLVATDTQAVPDTSD